MWVGVLAWVDGYVCDGNSHGTKLFFQLLYCFRVAVRKQDLKERSTVVSHRTVDPLKQAIRPLGPTAAHATGASSRPAPFAQAFTTIPPF